jgi:hypothetical protein
MTVNCGVITDAVTNGGFTHTLPVPCHAGLLRGYFVSLPFDLHSAAMFDSHMPGHGMCESALCVNQTRLHTVNQIGKPLAERHGRAGKRMGRAWYV